MVNPDTLCLGCMRIVQDSKKRCPYCGFEAHEYKKKQSAHVLPLMSIVGGKYLIGKTLGMGGFGITYLAWDLEIDRKVAIKEYFPTGVVTRDTTGGKALTSVSVVSTENPDYYQKGLKTFVQEARNLAKFDRLPNVVNVKDFFNENKTAYMVMEFLQGISLKEYLDQNGGRVSEEAAIQILAPVMKALESIHQIGVIHRDISPDNILIDKKGKVTLIDFGASRWVFGNKTQSMTVLLKHGYAPPEQYQTKGSQGPWTDVYAICATLYRMLTGEVPEPSIDRIQETDGLLPLKKYVNEKGEHLVSNYTSDVIQKGLSLKSTDRYQSMWELMEALEIQGAFRGNATPFRNTKYQFPLARIGVLVISAALLIWFGGNYLVNQLPSFPLKEAKNFTLEIYNAASGETYEEKIKEGTVFTRDAANAFQGEEFEKWTVDSGNVDAQIDGAHINFQMPDEDVKLTLHYKKVETEENVETETKYCVKVNDATSETIQTKEYRYLSGDLVQITVEQSGKTASYTFQNWSIDSQNIILTEGDLYSRSIAFIMPEKEVDLTCHWK